VLCTHPHDALRERQRKQAEGRPKQWSVARRAIFAAKGGARWHSIGAKMTGLGAGAKRGVRRAPGD